VVAVTGALPGGLLLAASSSKSSSSSSFTFIIFLVLIAAVGYFLLIRPQKQRARRQQAQQSNIGVGDEIQTVGGIVGRVVAIDTEHVTVVSGEDTVGFAAVGNQPTRLVLVRNAIARKIEPVVEEPVNDEYDAYDEHDEHDDGHPAGGDGRSAEGGGTGP
jgi:preprotein translocase subunit YajC